MSAVSRVDLADYRSDDAVRRSGFCDALSRGLVETGFIRVVGHRVDEGRVARVHDLFERFFDQPEQAKRRVAGVAGGQRGYTPFGEEHAKDHPTPDLKEFYHVGQEPSAGSPLWDRYPRNVWPEELPELRSACRALFRALEECASQLLRATAESFELPLDTFSSMLVDGNSILRALHYPPISADSDPRALRAAPHEDINLITLLCEATDSGLEILTPQGRWVEVETGPGEIIADAGDMLARVTNGRIPATTHRVTADAEARQRHRHALPFFAHPRPDCDLSVIPSFVAAGDEPSFAPITADEYLQQRLREIGLIS